MGAVIAATSALVGALIGVGGSLLIAARTEAAQRRREHREALVAYWAAVNTFATTYSSIAELLPPRANSLQRLYQGLQLGGFGSQLIERLWRVIDRLWEASGRLRVSASVQELAVLEAIERVIGDWAIGTPLPETWGPAVRDLRLLVEERKIGRP